jgi:hypothetical protein
VNCEEEWSTEKRTFRSSRVELMLRKGYEHVMHPGQSSKWRKEAGAGRKKKRKRSKGTCDDDEGQAKGLENNMADNGSSWCVKAD